MAKRIKIPGRIESAEMGGVVTGAADILDDEKGKKQSVINEEVDTELGRLDTDKQDNLTFDAEPTENSENPVTSGGVYAANLLLSQAIEAILLLIPSAASALNQLADKAFVNSSISTDTATFRGTYNVVSDLGLAYNATHAQIEAALLTHVATADNNDYAFVQIPVSGTSQDIAVTERYKFNGTAWAYEYDLNNSGFTAAQWSAINSGITTLLVSKLSALPTNEALTLVLAGKQDNLTFDNVPTEGSNNPVKSSGIYTRNNEIVALINALDAAKQNVLTFDTTPNSGSTNPVTSNGVYLAIQLVQTAVTALDGRMGTAETKISTAEGNIVNLQAAYAALTQSDIVVVSGALPSSGQQQNIIYRQPDLDHTPPQFYSDYMWNGTAWVLMATYNNAIDPCPKKGSQNLVTSGGVFDNMGALDVSELNATENPHTLAQYVDLSAALAAVPTDYQKGGMSIKFQSSDNKYVQYRYMGTAVTGDPNPFLDVANWQSVEEDKTLNYNYAKITGYYNLLWTQGKYILANGVVGNDPSFEATLDYIPVKSGDVIWCDLVVEGQGDYVVVYNSNKQYVNRYHNDGVRGFEITIEQDGYIRFSNRNNGVNNNPEVILENGKILDIINDLKENEIKDLQEQTNEIEKLVFRRLDLSNLEVGLLSSSNGSPIETEDNRYRYCPDYLEVFEGDVITTNAFANGSARGIVFYDENKEKYSAEESAPSTGIVVPQGAVYVRFCIENYNALTGLWARKVEDEYIDPMVDELDERVDALEDVCKTLKNKPFFNIGLDTWIADEDAKNFFPSTQRLNSKYSGDVSPEKRYIAIGFDDFRDTDFSMIIPLFDKYGAKALFNRVHRSIEGSKNDVIRINSLINGSHEIGDHTWLHYKYPFDEPLMNGQDPSIPEGSQVPFPSNSQLRDDVGNGKNVFGRPLTENIKSALGYEAPDLDTTWGALTDSECQYFRNYFSVMKDTSTNLINVLDSLSNLYLGTTGSSRGSWDSANSEYTGGIFTGCKTSQNHEIWERVLLVTNMYLKDKLGLNYNLITWSLPGSKDSGCYFPYDGNQYFDASHTKRRGNLARFESSVYKNNDGTAKNRSWTDVLREYGYKTTHDATPTSRDTCMAYQFIMNGQQSRPDALPHPTNRLLYYGNIESEYTEGTDLQGTQPYEVQMYDGGANSDKKSYRNEIEQWRHSAANGIIWGAVIDSNDTWSERMILEGLLKYGVKTGIEFVTHAEAYDICFNHPIKNGNLLYNPRLRNTAKEFMPTATTVQNNPDGYRGECSVSLVNGTPVLTITGETDYRHYGIPYGKIRYSADVKGNGSIEIRAIKNSTIIDSIKTSSVLLDTINISNNDYAAATSELIIPDNGIGVYDDVYSGYGDKIIGLIIIYSSGLEIKNIDLRML